jgi:hypothetical protein
LVYQVGLGWFRFKFKAVTRFKAEEQIHE